MAAKKKSTKKSTAKKKAGAKRKPNAAFMKAMTPSAQLSTVVGSVLASNKHPGQLHITLPMPPAPQLVKTEMIPTPFAETAPTQVSTESSAALPAETGKASSSACQAAEARTQAGSCIAPESGRLVCTEFLFGRSCEARTGFRRLLVCGGPDRGIFSAVNLDEPDCDHAGLVQSPAG